MAKLTTVAGYDRGGARVKLTTVAGYDPDPPGGKLTTVAGYDPGGWVGIIPSDRNRLNRGYDSESVTHGDGRP